MADIPEKIPGEMIRADIALREQLNRFFGDKNAASMVYHNRHELFILLIDWSTRIEQGLPGGEIDNGE